MFKFDIKKVNVAIDIGTNKTICVIFTLDSKNNPKIINWSHKKSLGINKGLITDKKLVSRTLFKVLKEAYNNKLIRNEKIVTNISDKNILTEKKLTQINLDGFKIRKKDIQKIKIRNNQNFNKPDMKLIHSFPICFKIDKKKHFEDPIGLNCRELELNSNNIFIRKKLINNLEDCFKNSNLTITDLVDSAFASSIGCLSEDEKKTSVLCIDIGAGISKFSIFLNGKLELLDYLNLGGNDVTNDISNGLEIAVDLSEYIKIVHGSLQFNSNENLKINLPNGKEKIITKNLLNGIIKPRYEEIFELIRERINCKINDTLLIQKIILTGGASQMNGAAQLSEKIFNRKSEIQGPITKVSYFNNKPEFSTIFGLIMSQNLSKFHFYKSNQKINKILKIVNKFDDWVSDSYT